MTELRKAASQALEAFESGLASERADAMKALRQALENPEPVAHRLHETDIYEFAGWLTTRPGIMEVGATSEAGPMAEAVGEYLRSFPEKFTAVAQSLPQLEPVTHTLNCVCGAVWDVSPDGVEEMVHAPTPPQRKLLTDEEIEDAWECVTGHNISFGYRKEGRTMYISPDEVIEFARIIEKEKE